MNVENRTIFEGDNLHILRGLDSETIDLIYLDPPFNSNRTYEAPIGSDAAGAAFKDAWTLSDLDNAWHGELAEREPALYSAISASEFSHSKGMKAYLIMMGIRMLEMWRVMKPTGSIYLHCDPTAGHYLKTMMDAVFGTDNFRNEIVWCYRGAGYPKKDFGRRHDIIFRYSKGAEYIFNLDDVREEYAETTKARFKHYIGNKRKQGDFGLQKLNPLGKHPDDWWQIQPIAPSAKERLGYPTQKPLTLLDRIIKASSNRGDIVFDPFCGCATTCIAAERLQRQWIGIDLSAKAMELVKVRLARDLEITEHEGLLGDKVIHRTDIPTRLVPDEPRQIHAATLFSIEDSEGMALSQVELRQYKTYKHTLFGLQEGKCNGCEVLFPFRNMTIDHIMPRSRGGTDAPDNLQLLCAACNSTKGNRTQEYLIQALRDQGVIREDIEEY